MESPLAEFNDERCLIHGIGNVARQDDGLGWAFIDWLEREGLCPRAQKIRHYQLFLEDADLLSRMDRVLFVDEEIAQAIEPGTEKVDVVLTRPVQAGEHRIYVRIEQVDGNVAWSSPFWVTAMLPTEGDPGEAPFGL